MRKASSWLVAGVLALAACGGSADKQINVASRDSSGVTILDHPAGSLATVARYGVGTPIHSLGGPGADSLHNPMTMRSAVFTGHGHYIVLDGADNRFMLFDSNGTVIGTYGRRGPGTDSLRSPSQPRFGADGSIWFMDLPARLIRVTADLRPMSMHQLGPKEPVAATAVLPAGNGVIAIANEFTQPKTADTLVHRNKQYLLALRPDGVDTLTSWLGGEWYIESSSIGGEKMVTTQPLRFGRSTVVRPWGNQIVVATGDNWSFEVRDSTGKLKEIVALHEPRRAVTVALKDSIKARDLRQIASMQGADDQMKAQVRASLDQERFADSVAPFEDAIEARDGSLWMAETTLPTDSLRRYSVFDKDGHLTRRVELPARNRILAADSDLVLVRRVDTGSVSYFDLARITRLK